MAISLGGDPRTRTTTMAGGALVLLLSALAVHQRGESTVPPTPEAVAAECRRLYTELNPTSSAQPAQRFELRQSDELLRVYVSRPDDWIIACRSGPTGVDAVAGTPMGDGSGGRLRLFGASGSVLATNLLLGHVPAGATTIEATLTTGEVVSAAHDGSVFAVWSPDVPVAGARVTATGPGAATSSVTAP